MDDEYLAPTDISFTTPFKRNYGGVGNGNDSYDGRNSFNANEDDLSFLDNFQHLGLSDKKGKESAVHGDAAEVRQVSQQLNSTFEMGVAESKEDVQEEIPSFVNFGDAPPPRSPQPQSPVHMSKSPIHGMQKKIHQPDMKVETRTPPPAPPPVAAAFTPEPSALKPSAPKLSTPEPYTPEPYTPEPSTPKLSIPEPFAPKANTPEPCTPASTTPVAPYPPVKPSPEPPLIGSRTPHPELKRLQDLLLRQEQEFQAELAKQDSAIKDKELQLDTIYKKMDTLRDQEKPGNLKKVEAKIASLTAEVENLQVVLVQAEGGNVEVINEREQHYADLRSVENAYTDLMGKYQRAMECMSTYRSNEQELKIRDQESAEKIAKKDQKYEMLKSQVQESIESMHQDYDTKLKDKKHDNENLRVRLMRMEMRVDTLENDLEQKTRENSQLHTLCDEIISGQVAS